MEEKRIQVSELLSWPSSAPDKVSNSRQRRKNSGRGHRSEDAPRTPGVVETAFAKSEGVGGKQDSSGVVAGGESGTAGRASSSVGERSKNSSPGLPRLRLRASLAAGRKCISFDQDGECLVMFDIPGSFLPEALKLTLYKGKTFWMEIME